MKPEPFFRATCRALCALMLALTAASIVTASAQDLSEQLDPAVERELIYADALIQWGLPDYADMVLQGPLLRSDPSAKLRVKVLRLNQYITQGKFDEIQRIIDAEADPDSQSTWAMKLKMADGYYAWGKYPEAQTIYEGFFKRFETPPESLNQFYMNSAYKYAQMLLLMGNDKAALKAYGYVRKAKLPAIVERQVRCETAEIMVKLAEEAPKAEKESYLAKATDIASDVLWVNNDMWFAKGIVILAHIKLIEGDIEGATGLIDDYKKDLKAIDEQLREQGVDKLSPMAECHYLLGQLMHEEAKKLIAEDVTANKDKIIELLAGKEVLREDGAKKKRTYGALQHFFYVFIRYPNSNWAPDAGAQLDDVEGILTRDPFNAEITKSVTDERMAKVKQAQFESARVIYNQQQFEKAIETYLNVLNLFPEDPPAVMAVGDLARCYVELQDEIYTDTAIHYLAERFCRNPDLTGQAGDELLRLAEMFGERKLPDKREAVYSLFFKYFDGHTRAPAMYFRFGEQRYAEGEHENALTYYQKIVDSYTNATVYLPAMSKVASCYSQMTNHVQEARVLQRYIAILEADEKPELAEVNAQFRLALALEKIGGKYLPTAAKKFSDLVKLLAPEDHPYQKEVGDKEKAAQILEAAIFYKAICFSRLTPPEGKPEAYYRPTAIKTFEQLVAIFPESEFAPLALSQVGTLNTLLEKPEEAEKALRQLKDKYPDSIEAKNVDFTLGMNLLKLGKRRQATKVFKDMFSGSGATFSHAQILRAANELQNAGEHDIALTAYNKLLGESQERAVVESATVGKGRILMAQKEYDAAATLLDDLLAKYPKSGYAIEICAMLSIAHSSVAMEEPERDERMRRFNRAIGAMKTARRFETSSAGYARLDNEVARITVMKAHAEAEHGDEEKAREYIGEAVATYQSLILLGDFNDPGVRQHIEVAMKDCMPLLVELERWDDILEDAAKYKRMFPQGKYQLAIDKAANTARMRKAAAGAVDPVEPADTE